MLIEDCYIVQMECLLAGYIVLLPYSMHCIARSTSKAISVSVLGIHLGATVGYSGLQIPSYIL